MYMRHNVYDAASENCGPLKHVVCALKPTRGYVLANTFNSLWQACVRSDRVEYPAVTNLDV